MNFERNVDENSDFFFTRSYSAAEYAPSPQERKHAIRMVEWLLWEGANIHWKDPQYGVSVAAILSHVQHYEGFHDYFQQVLVHHEYSIDDEHFSDFTEYLTEQPSPDVVLPNANEQDYSDVAKHAPGSSWFDTKLFF